jgi:polysaccharide deacetylase family protein (PEP-CTERM system associated)
MLSKPEKNQVFSVLSVDVEDGLSIAMRDLLNIEIAPTERVIKNVNILLSLFAEKKFKATFFVLGEVAFAFPELVKTIASYGHEVAVHGYYHDQFFKISRVKAKEDIGKAKALIEEITGNRVYGFRAPAFSISTNTSWALDTISELGFKYDSSIVPAKVDRYGWPGFAKDIHRLVLPSGNSIIEVPLSVIKIFGKLTPACGGGYLRHLPYIFTKKAFLSIQKRRPVIVYLHPYEIDKEKYPDFFYKARSSASFRKKLPLMFYRLGKNGLETKLDHLLKEFQFKPIIEIIDNLEINGDIPNKHI